MTLIITAVNKLHVVQVSDRRLTRGGTLVDDNANKAICVISKYSRFSIAYTGLAEIKKDRQVLHTDEWIADCLASIHAGNLSLFEIASVLKKQLTNTIEAQPWKFTDNGLTLAIAGYCHDKMFVGGISNM